MRGESSIQNTAKSNVLYEQSTVICGLALRSVMRRRGVVNMAESMKCIQRLKRHIKTKPSSNLSLDSSVFCSRLPHGRWWRRLHRAKWWRWKCGIWILLVPLVVVVWMRGGGGVLMA